MEIIFYDKGYTQLEDNINNMKYIARLLMVMGTVMVLMVLIYFSWLFILKQEERTAIERALGFRKRQCFFSLFSGIFLIIFIGSVCGSLMGSGLAGEIAGEIENKSYYDTTFGNSAAAAQEKLPEEEVAAQENPLSSAGECALAILAAGTVISTAGILRNLRREPMQMFAQRRE